ncbi:hypothetical protein SETIT_3G297600v2 [Setaria italica]|uniref:NmrA-like domain-containing protein n=1 Tax=Setaria italica TaxID=4555 RepID=A0A368QM96_SETIT|nr:hypothetical protein SETIT_3G297600v2 [Setaria italica]
MEKCRVLVVDGTGFIRRQVMTANLVQDHPAYLQRLLFFNAQGAQLMEVSRGNHTSLVITMRQSGHNRVNLVQEHNLLQLKLMEAIKKAGNVRSFIASEFGTGPASMEHALETGRTMLQNQMVIGRAMEEASIPHTYFCKLLCLLLLCLPLSNVHPFPIQREILCIWSCHQCQR